MADLGVHPHVPVEGDVVGLLEGEGEGEGRLLEPAGALGGEGGGRDELGVHVVEGERLEAHTHGAGGRAGRLEVRLLAVQQRVHDHHVVCVVRSLPRFSENRTVNGYVFNHWLWSLQFVFITKLQADGLVNCFFSSLIIMDFFRLNFSLKNTNLHFINI